jgi:hypothetical protein
MICREMEEERENEGGEIETAALCHGCRFLDNNNSGSNYYIAL